MPRTTDTHAAMFEQLRSRLESISYRIVRSEAEAEDIVQECFLKWHGAEKDALMTPVASLLPFLLSDLGLDCVKRLATAKPRNWARDVLRATAQASELGKA
jgi:DNA-directed RNA polymerase specialized sigma24 family protein